MQTNMKSDTFTFNASDGVQVFVYKWLPDDASRVKAAVQIAHGMAEHAARYERFADDGLSSRLHIWSLQDRWCLGGRYSFRDDKRVQAYAQFEYRHSIYRPAAATRRDNDEIFLRAGMSF